MRLRRTFVAGLAASLTLALVPASPAGAQSEEDDGFFATADVVDASGVSVGVASIYAFDGLGDLYLDVEGLEPGFHALHVHDTGVCEAPFDSAGGHLGADEAAHGAHAGDLPAVLVNEDGTGSMSSTTNGLTRSALFDADGSALVIHAGADNLANLPDRYVPPPDATTLATGDAGARVACGVIEEEDLGFEEEEAAARRQQELSGFAEASAVLHDPSGAAVGSVSAYDEVGETTVPLFVELTGLDPGFHGVHLRQVGTCEPPFTSAGAHLGAGATDHPDHQGDLPPVLVGADGIGYLTIESDRFGLDELFDADGTALVVTDGPDNLANVPDRYLSSEAVAPGPDATTLETGDAGSPVACGALQDISLELLQAQNYVRQVYDDLLGRPVDVAALDYWAERLIYAEDRDRARFTRAVLGSPEHADRVVASLFTELLGRRPDRAAADFFRRTLLAGTPVEAVESTLYGSREYRSLAGTGPDAFLRALYRDVLGRSLDRPGRDHWTARLRAGLSRAGVAAALIRSPEAAGKRVVATYGDLLGRRPDRGGLTAFTAFLVAGGDRRAVVGALAASEEHYYVAAQRAD